MTQNDKEIVKSALNFLYWVVNYCFIEDKITGAEIKFNLWPEQRRILKQFLTAIRLIILKARQLGLTWLTAAYCLWLSMFNKLQLIVVISAKEDWAIEFLDRVKFIFDRLPVWMKPKVLKRTGQELTFGYEEKDENGNIVIKGLNSTIKSLATTPEGAQSKTVTLLVLDETARNRYVKQIWGASKPGLDSGGGRVIVISNSIKDGVGWGWTRQLYTDSMKGINDFVRIFLAWWAHPNRGKNFLEQQKTEGMDEDDISQHYPETEQEAISTMLGSYFGKVLARHTNPLKGIRGYLIRNKADDLEFVEHTNGLLEIWRYPYYLHQDWDGLYWKNRYVIGSDISEGLGGTYSVAYVKDQLTDEIICRARSNRIDADDWGYFLYDLGYWYDKALICPERTGAGITTCKCLEKLNYPRLYVRMRPALAGNPMTKEIGWHESQTSRPELCQDLKTYLKTTQAQIYCGLLIEECSTFIRDENGRLGPEEGKLADCVFAAGCMEQASYFSAGPPKQIQPELTGWRARLRNERKEETVWARP